MLDIIDYIAGCAFISLVHLYIWSKLLDKKLNFKNVWTYFGIMIFVVFVILNYMYINQAFKVLTITLIMMVFCKLLYKVDVNKAILAPILSQMILFFGELIYAFIILIIVNPSTQEIIDDFFATFMTNIFIGGISIFLSKIFLFKKLFQFLVKVTKRLKKYELMILMIILILSFNLIFMSIYYKLDIKYLLILNLVLMFIYGTIIIKMANTKNEYLTISEKYNRSKNSLTEYQSVVSRYRIDNHENKSQLKRLRNKIDKENKEAIEYIDMILDTRIKNNEKILNKTKIIPDSDLKVLIDSKIMTMEEKNINNKLHVDKEVKTIDLIEIDQLLMEDICKIAGVYLDNAIEAVETLDKKEIQLDLYKLDDFLCISVVNNYEGEIELDKLYDVGYTTKDNGHGYGLPLVAEIVDNNKNLSKETHVNEEIFRQVLKIKM